MDTEELKRKMLGLWEKTTRNSKELISGIFDVYFDQNFVEYTEIEGKVIAALFGIPYEFYSGRKKLKALYIIYLSSDDGFRKKSVLTELLSNFNKRHAIDFDFTFLVPRTDLLADYFGTQGYFSSFYIIEERFTALHDFKKDYLLTLNDSEERIRNLKSALLQKIEAIEVKKQSYFDTGEIINFILGIEKKNSGSVSLIHEYKDMDYILREDSLRNLEAYISFDTDKKITGVAFTQKEDIKRTKVIATFVSDICSYFVLLDYIKKSLHDHSISVMTSDPKFQTLSIIQQTYVSQNPDGPDFDNSYSTVEIQFNLNRLLEPLGMVKILRFDRIIEFIAETHSDANFNLCIRDLPTQGNTKLYTVKNGKTTEEPYDLSTKEKNKLILSVKEVSELLLRKTDSNNLIMEAFGIPRLNLQMRLLPF